MLRIEGDGHDLSFELDRIEHGLLRVIAVSVNSRSPAMVWALSASVKYVPSK